VSVYPCVVCGRYVAMVQCRCIRVWSAVGMWQWFSVGVSVCGLR